MTPLKPRGRDLVFLASMLGLTGVTNSFAAESNLLKLEELQVTTPQIASIQCGQSEKPALGRGQVAYQLSNPKIVVDRTKTAFVSLTAQAYECENSDQPIWKQVPFDPSDTIYFARGNKRKTEPKDLLRSAPAATASEARFALKLAPLLSPNEKEDYLSGFRTHFTFTVGVAPGVPSTDGKFEPDLSQVLARYDADASIHIQAETLPHGQVSSDADPRHAYSCGDEATIPEDELLLPVQRAEDSSSNWFYRVSYARAEIVGEMIRFQFGLEAKTCEKLINDGKYHWVPTPFPKNTRAFVGLFQSFVGSSYRSDRFDISDDDMQTYIEMTKDYHSVIDKSPYDADLKVPLKELIQSGDQQKLKAGEKIHLQVAAGISSNYQVLESMNPFARYRYGWLHMDRVYPQFRLEFIVSPDLDGKPGQIRFSNSRSR